MMNFYCDWQRELVKTIPQETRELLHLVDKQPEILLAEIKISGGRFFIYYRLDNLNF